MSQQHKKTVVVVTGPTAVGKTSVAIQLAKHFQTSIISADSRQCYQELRIGVARPSPQELAEVKHYFIATHSIRDEVTAAGFEKYALSALGDIFKTNDNAVVTGGTGLYIKALCEGLDEIPEINPGTREAIGAHYREKGIEWLRGQLLEKDKLFAEKGEMKNPQRMMRALEVVESTGRSICLFQTREKALREFNIIKLGLSLPAVELHKRIKQRVDNMVGDGLLEEIKELLPFRTLKALQTVGYKEFF